MRSTVSTFAEIQRLSLDSGIDKHIFLSYEFDLVYRTLHSSSGQAYSVTSPFQCSSKAVTYSSLSQQTKQGVAKHDIDNSNITMKFERVT